MDDSLAEGLPDASGPSTSMPSMFAGEPMLPAGIPAVFPDIPASCSIAALEEHARLAAPLCRPLPGKKPGKRRPPRQADAASRRKSPKPRPKASSAFSPAAGAAAAPFERIRLSHAPGADAFRSIGADDSDSAYDSACTFHSASSRSSPTLSDASSGTPGAGSGRVEHPDQAKVMDEMRDLVLQSTLRGNPNEKLEDMRELMLRYVVTLC